VALSGFVTYAARQELEFDIPVPHLATCIFLIFYNEPELGAGIDHDMGLTSLPSSIGRGLKSLNPQPSHHKSSALPLDHSFCLLACLTKGLYTLDIFAHNIAR